MSLSRAQKSNMMIDEEEPEKAHAEESPPSQENVGTPTEEESPLPEEEATPMPQSEEEPPQETPPTLTEEEAPQEEALSPEKQEDGIAHVDFELLDTEGRWLLKVISGPNTGAEFAIHSGSSYLLGTDTKECDIVFQDLSISRKHARLSVDIHEHAFLEDLTSKNGTFIGGEKISKKEISGNVLVTMGTTSFMLYDREAEHTTIIAPSTQEKREEHKEAKKEEVHLGPIQEAVLPPLQSEVERVKEEERYRAKSSKAISSLIILGIVTGLILLLGVGTIFLFRTEEITAPTVIDPEKEITTVMKEYPAVKFSFNSTNGKLMLVGHVLAITDRSRLIDSLQRLTFVRDIDYSSVVIDELVWREINQLLSKNPTWRGISLTSPSAGRYVITGFLRTRNQSVDLFDYLSLNFPYTDLLEKKVVIEEDLLGQVTRELAGSGFRGVTPSFANGELTLAGSMGRGTAEKFQKLITLFKSLPGIRNVNSLVTEAGQKEALVDLTEKYRVSGYASSGKKSSVVVNGRILGPGDVLDGMMITEITSTTIYLEKDGVKYKIDFNR